MQNSHLLIRVDYLFQLKSYPTKIFSFGKFSHKLKLFYSDQIWLLTLIFAEIFLFLPVSMAKHPTFRTYKSQNYFLPEIHLQFQ